MAEKQLPAPAEIREIDPQSLVNVNDKKRASFWSDAAALFDRRISAIEKTLTRSIWSLPVIAALAFSVIALSLAIYLLYRTMRRSFL